MAEYAYCYGGPPGRKMSWFLFLALVDRTARFDARSRLRQLDSVANGIDAAFGSDATNRDDLVERAYPVAGKVREPMINSARIGSEETRGDG